MTLYHLLKQYSETDAYPFHMPGHKRRLGAVEEVRALDITEIEGFDNLHHAEGVLKEAQERAAGLYGSEDTYYLVNGSTTGILAAISACVRPGGKLLMARNSHKAAYHAAELRQLKTSYLYPQYITLSRGPDKREYLSAMSAPERVMSLPERNMSAPEKVTSSPEEKTAGSIDPEDVRAALEADREIEAVFITSPTYEGIVSDVKRIAGITHSFGIPLIVDEAHGAHFGFHPYFPESSVKLGADIVIHSLHKTMPSLTQTALLHRNGSLTDADRIRKYLDIYQTSSPSYVLMAGIDACVELMERRGAELFEKFVQNLEWFRGRAGKWRHIRLLEARAAFAQDRSKLVLCAKGRSGKWLADSLREQFHLELEMAAGGYAIALTSAADSAEGFERLADALGRLDEQIGQGDRGEIRMSQKKPEHAPCAEFLRNEQACTIAQADARPKIRTELSKSEGKVSAEYLYLYPPGIPAVAPGERVSPELLEWVRQCREADLSLQGLSDHSAGTILICADII